jgi:hypothetical protein
MSWITALVNRGSDEFPKEKTIFIPKEKIVSAVLRKETKWYKKIFSSVTPRMVIRYCDVDETEKELVLNAEYKSDGIAELLGKT